MFAGNLKGDLTGRLLRTGHNERFVELAQGLRLLDEPFIDTKSEISDLVLYIIGWAARWQRQWILENTAYGREAAR